MSAIYHRGHRAGSGRRVLASAILAGILSAWLYNCDSSYQADPVSSGVGTPLNDAVDNMTIVLEEPYDSASPWIRQTAESNDGLDAAQSGPILGGQKSCFQTLIRTAARYSFFWKISAPSSDTMKFYINGIEQRIISGEEDWREATGTTGSEMIHLLTWCYEKNGDAIAGANAGWVDQLVIEKLNLLSLSTALDDADSAALAPESQSGRFQWFGYMESDGANIAQSARIDHGEATCFQVTVAGAQMVSFYWKISSQEAADFLKLYSSKNGAERIERESISGEQDWHKIEVLLNEDGATYNLEWCYEKDDSGIAGADAGWVDRIAVDRIAIDRTVIDPEPSLQSIIEALDIAGEHNALNQSSQNSADWFAQSNESYDGVDAVQSGSISLPTEQSCFEISITGAGRISFYWKLRQSSQDVHLRFYIDDLERSSIDAEAERWEKREITVGGEENEVHLLKWCYEIANGNSPSDSTPYLPGWVDQLEIEKVTVAEPWAAFIQSIDPRISYELNRASLNWFGQSLETGGAGGTGGGSAAQSGNLGPNDSSCMEMQIELPIEDDIAEYESLQIDFDWKVSAATDGSLYYLAKESLYPLQIADGTMLEHESDWQSVQRNFPIPAADPSSPIFSYSLEWCYHKQDDTASQSDAGWLDNLSLSLVK